MDIIKPLSPLSTFMSPVIPPVVESAEISYNKKSEL